MSIRRRLEALETLARHRRNRVARVIVFVPMRVAGEPDRNRPPEAWLAEQRRIAAQTPSGYHFAFWPPVASGGE